MNNADYAYRHELTQNYTALIPTKILIEAPFEIEASTFLSSNFIDYFFTSVDESILDLFAKFLVSIDGWWSTKRHFMPNPD
jgi:hypothetical protein